MFRLILIAAFVAVVAIAVSVVIGTIKAINDFDDKGESHVLPGKLSSVTYVLLMLILLGLATGLLGAS